MAKKKLWFGYLEAGSKSSPVVIDRNLEPADANTLYVYNHKQKEIKKYIRELIEPKLRDLSSKEKKLEAELKKGYSKSLKNGNSKILNVLKIPEKEITKEKPEKMPMVVGLEVDGLDDDIDDADWDDDKD